MHRHILQYLDEHIEVNKEYKHLQNNIPKKIHWPCTIGGTFHCCVCRTCACLYCNRHNILIKNISGKFDTRLAICNTCALKKVFDEHGDVFKEFLKNIMGIVNNPDTWEHFRKCDDNCGYNVKINKLTSNISSAALETVVYYDMATESICMGNSLTKLKDLCMHCKYVRFNRCNEFLVSILMTHSYIPSRDNSIFDVNKLKHHVRNGGSEVYICLMSHSFIKYIECDRFHFSQLSYIPKYLEGSLIFRHNMYSSIHINNVYEDLHADFVLSKYYGSTTESTPNKKIYYKQLYVYINNSMIRELDGSTMSSPKRIFSEYFLPHTETKLFKKHIHVSTTNDPDFIMELNNFRRTNNHRFCMIIPIDGTYFNYIFDKILYRASFNWSEHKIIRHKIAKQLYGYFNRANFRGYTSLYPDNEYARLLLKTNLYLTLAHLDPQWIDNVFIVNDQVIVLSPEKKLAHDNVNQILSHIRDLKKCTIKTHDNIGDRMTWSITGKLKFYDLRRHSLCSNHQTIIYSDVIRRCFLKWMAVLYRPIHGSRYLAAKVDFDNMRINM